MKNINYRISSTLEKSEIVMKNTFWIGLYPGLSNKHLDFSSEIIKEFFKK
jgi:CDP-6-deoxy-D-xylo-4-hexulose-3-dehydrase